MRYEVNFEVVETITDRENADFMRDEVVYQAATMGEALDEMLARMANPPICIPEGRYDIDYHIVIDGYDEKPAGFDGEYEGEPLWVAHGAPDAPEDDGALAIPELYMGREAVEIAAWAARYNSLKRVLDTTK